ncbi:LPS-assembly protein LptD [Hansschlegelia beijingensis]|uniref:LPS-assembly protein LptD n=1 Tax=Hansschlegelia beijingensis TaxID=1133344 RepID=A0A7W6D791_9HYPH|nr:LPS-assembly protein LptD [Hansschlegelia beijingensis]MBB3974458.1 LPS-assembly protein [Hansschlegelia beijingensis]
MTLAPRAASRRSGAVLAAFLLASTAVALATGGAFAQGAQSRNELIPPQPHNAGKKHEPGLLSSKSKPVVAGSEKKNGLGQRDPNARMVMEAKELVYDYDKEVVTAVGGVDIYYDGRALQADRVAYDQKQNRVRAYGNVKFTERNGDVAYGDTMDVTDDFRDGFVTPLRVETTDRTHFAAVNGRRENGNLMVFDRGVYTACEPCRNNPEKPPLWQIRAKRIIWRQDEQTIYYDNATFELFGKPIAWLPYFSSPDPTVKRKSGVLAPSLTRSGRVGYGIEIPYYWVLSPESDLTLSAMATSKQGVMLKGHYRQQLMDGAYSIRAAGIHQLDSKEFNGKVPPGYTDAGLSVGSGDKDNRWAFQTKGQFDINEKWSWGWDINALSDKWVRGDYDLWGSRTDATSTLFLTGQGDRSWFELRGYRFYGLTRYDRQDRLPWVAPVLDYNYTFENPVAGGELSFDINATNLYREESDYARYLKRSRPRTDNALVGAAGTYSRLSGDMEWRRRFIDPIGQVWTPFAFVRGDLIYTKPDYDPAMPAFLDHEQDVLLRGMAGVGLEYRYPFIAVSSFGTHQIEPIAQVIFRPNEGQVGKLPNEDAQSLLFDDTTLFAWNKFSGYDRIEGGSRANVGAQYTLTADSGASVSMLVGQSFALFGKNSFDRLDPTRIGPDSGLSSKRSDYVGGLTIVPNEHFGLASHIRLDEDSFALRSAEVEARATFERVQANLIYGRYEKAPLQGYDDIREGILGGARVFLTQDFYVEGGARYNFERDAFDRTQVGFGLNDIAQCLSFGFSYIRQVDNSADSVRLSQVDNKFLVKLDFRTLGSVGVSTSSKSNLDPDMFGSHASSFAP